MYTGDLWGINLVNIVEDHKDTILKIRNNLHPTLSKILCNLDSIFSIKTKVESNTWAAYSNNKLLLTSELVIGVTDTDKFRSIGSIKNNLSVLLSIGGNQGGYSLNTYSIFFEGNRLELFVHRDIPHIFIKMYVFIDTDIPIFDGQLVSESYFNLINANRLVFM